MSLMELLLLVIHLTVLALLIYRMNWFRKSGIPSSWMLSVFALKVVLGLLAGYLYLNWYGGGDTYTFFRDGKDLHDMWIHTPDRFYRLLSGGYDKAYYETHYYFLRGWLNDDFLYNDNRTVTLTHTLLHFISGGTYGVHVTWFCFFALFGLTGWYRYFKHALSLRRSLAFGAIYLAPSILIWLSVASKESLVTAFLGTLLGGLHLLLTSGQKIKNWTITLLGLIACFFLKVYLILLLLPPLTAWLIVRGTTLRRTWMVYTVVYAVVLTSLVGIGMRTPNFRLPELLYAKKTGFEGPAQKNPEGFSTWIELPAYEPEWGSMCRAALPALGTAFTQPVDFSGKNLPMLFFSVENALLVLLVMYALWKILRHRKSHRTNTLLLILCFYGSLLILIGLTIPVSGALIRYKAVALPLLLLLPAVAFDWRSADRTRIEPHID